MFNIGVVGAGIIADYHKKAIIKNKELHLVAVCDLDIDKAKNIADGTSARVYTDYKEMCKNEKLDAVILNLPHFLHMEVSIYFLKHCVTVLVEKPMANNAAECTAMIETSKKYNTPLVVGHVQKYLGCYRMLKEIIQSERLGKLCSMTETRNTDYFTNRPSWFLDKKLAGGGIVMNYCAHTLDKLFYATELTVKDVFASGNNFITEHNVEASAQVLLKLSSGATAAFTYCGTKVPGQYDTYFYFTQGTVYIEDGGRKLQIKEKDKETEFFEFDDYVFTNQIDELEKLLKGEPNELVTCERGKEIVEVLEKIMNCIDKE